jgi:hypothetical protein
MPTKRTASQLDREIASTLRHSRHSSHHATTSASADARQEFIAAYLALQHAFEAADEVAAKAYNQAVRAGVSGPALSKLKNRGNRMEKALRTYGEDVDELLRELDY